MNFTAEKKHITEAIQQASAVAERRNTIPILANMKMVAEEKGLIFTATDLEIQIKSISEGVEVQEEGRITVSAKKMSELCKSLPEDEKINFFVEQGKLSIRAKSFQADLVTISAEEFPELECSESLTEITIPSDDLRAILHNTHFSMASQDVRYYLNGLYLELEGKKINAVATDGHRLAMSSRSLTDAASESANILPRKAVLELTKILLSSDKLVNLTLGLNFLKVRSSKFEFSTKLIDGKFPDYNKVFPTGEAHSLVINRGILLSALNRAAVLSNEKYRGVRLSLSNNALKLTANNPEQESAEEDLEVNYEGPSFEIGFNIGYLEEALNALDSEEAEILFYGEDSSCLVKTANVETSLYVVMPMRL